MNQSLDPLIVATTIASIIFGPALASIIGPYAVIVVAATFGAAIGVGRRETEMTRLQALWFYFRMVLAAILFTVPVAEALSRYFGLSEFRWMLALVAAFIGGVGDNWRGVGVWLIGQAKSHFKLVAYSGKKRK